MKASISEGHYGTYWELMLNVLVHKQTGIRSVPPIEMLSGFQWDRTQVYKSVFHILDETAFPRQHPCMAHALVFATVVLK